MHSRAVVASRVARRCVPSSRGAQVVAVQQRHSSFIKKVMEQVEKDMEKDPKMKQDWEKVQQSSKRMAERGQTMEERLSDMGDNLKSVSAKTSDLLASFKERTKSTFDSASHRMHQVTEESEALKKAREALGKHAETGATASTKVLDKGKDAFASVMDKSTQVLDFITDADKKGEKTKKWGANRATVAQEAQAQAQAKAAAAEDPAAAAAHDEAQAPPSAETGLVVSEARDSSWDRFGARVRDMPFIASVFENPLFDRIFGESEIAASIREMKEMDYTFQLEEFAEDIEYIVAPHIIQTFLEGDQEALERHCGEAAFAAVNASIKARQQQKLSLDPAILAGPKEMQLVSAKLNEKGPPTFIWMFTMQQVNCLRDHTGEIIEGAVDDIRNVCYAMAVNRHPNIDKPEEALEYPWQVSELAILWNQPCF